MKEYREVERDFEQGAAALFGLIRSTCSAAAEARIEKAAEFSTAVDDQDGILLLVIAERVCGPAASLSKASDITSELNRLHEIKQKSKEPIEEFVHRFRKQLKVVLSVHPSFDRYEQVRVFLSATESRFREPISQRVSIGAGFPDTFEDAAEFLVNWDKNSGGLVGLFKSSKATDFANPATGHGTGTGKGNPNKNSSKSKFGPCELCKSKGEKFNHSPFAPYCPLRTKESGSGVSTGDVSKSYTGNSNTGTGKTNLSKPAGKKGSKKKSHTVSFATDTMPDIVMSAYSNNVPPVHDTDDDFLLQLGAFGVSDVYLTTAMLEAEGEALANFSQDDPALESASSMVNVTVEHYPSVIRYITTDFEPVADEYCVEIIYDTGANVTMVNDLSLLRGAVASDYQRSVSGLSADPVIATHTGALLPFDSDALYCASLSRNLLSHSRLVDNGFSITYVQSADVYEASICIRAQSITFVFDRTAEGLYALRLPRSHFLDFIPDDGVARARGNRTRGGRRSPGRRGGHSAGSVVSTTDGIGDLSTDTVDRIGDLSAGDVNTQSNIHTNTVLDHVGHLSAAERERAKAVLDLHSSLCHPSDEYLGRALDGNAYRDTSLTSKDLRNARALHGPCPACAMGKMTEAPAPASTSPPADPFTKLHIDYFFIRGVGGLKVPYLLSVEESTGHLTVVKCASRTKGSAVEAVIKIIAGYKAYGHVIKAMRSDREAAFVAMESEINQLGVTLDRSAAGRHARVAERAIRTIKDRVRATRYGLPYRLPLDMLQYLVFDVVSSLNNTVNNKTGSRTPRDLLTGAKLSLRDHYSLRFGAIAVFKLPKGRDADDSPRGVFGVVIGRDLSSKGAMKVYLLGTRSIITVRHYSATPLTQDLIASMNSLADRDPSFPEEELITRDFEQPTDPVLEGIIDVTGESAGGVLEVEEEPSDFRMDPSSTVVPTPMDPSSTAVVPTVIPFLTIKLELVAILSLQFFYF